MLNKSIEDTLNKTHQIVIGSAVADEFLYQKVIGNLTKALTLRYGISPKVVKDVDARLNTESIIIGGPSNNKTIKTLVDDGLLKIPSDMKAESFTIKTLKTKGAKTVAVVGHDARGDAFGVSWLIDRILSKKDSDIDVYRAPAFPLRPASALAPMFARLPEIAWHGDEWNADIDRPFGMIIGGFYAVSPYQSRIQYFSPGTVVNERAFRAGVERFKVFCDIMLGLGINGVTLGSVIRLIMLDKFDIYPENSVFRVRHNVYRKYYKEMIDYAKKLHLDFYMMTDEFIYTQPMENEIGKICPANPRLWDFYRAKYEELFETFPQLDGIIVRLGEIFPSKEYKATDLSKHSCPDCEHLGGQWDKWRMQVKEIQQIARKYNKTYIHRIWTLGDDEIHSRTDLYDKVFGGLPKDNLIVSVKNTKTDFYAYQPLNPNIGFGDKDQIIEFQCNQEYHGQGAFPYYPGEEWRDQMRQCVDKGVKGIWPWPTEGPVPIAPIPIAAYFMGFSHWIQANMYLCSRLGWDPSEDPSDIAKNWAAREYGSAASEKMALILQKSYDALKKGLYLKPYAENHVWIPNPWLFEGIIFDRDVIRKMYAECKDRLEETIQEGWEAVKISDEMLILLQSARRLISDNKLYEASRSSLELLNCILRLLANYREAFLRLFNSEELQGCSRQQALDKAQAAMKKLSAVKQVYEQKFADKDYQMDGIEEFLQKYLK